MSVNLDLKNCSYSEDLYLTLLRSKCRQLYLQLMVDVQLMATQCPFEDIAKWGNVTGYFNYYILWRIVILNLY